MSRCSTGVLVHLMGAANGTPGLTSQTFALSLSPLSSLAMPKNAHDRPVVRTAGPVEAIQEIRIRACGAARWPSRCLCG